VHRPWHGSWCSARLDCVRWPACPDPPFCTSAVLMGAYDGDIDHRVLVVRLLSQGLEHPLPNPAVAPARVTGVHDTEIAKACRQVSPRNSRSVAVQHGIHEQPVVFCCGSGMSCLTWQQVFDACPLPITEGISFAHCLCLALQPQLSMVRILIDDTPWPPLRHDAEKQIHRKNHQMNNTGLHCGVASAQGQRHHEQRQQQHDGGRSI